MPEHPSSATFQPSLSDMQWMTAALQAARHAGEQGDVPIGAVVVGADGTLLSTGENRKERDQLPIAHAEIIALTKAAQSTKSWRLDGATLFSTVEPCVMCAGAILQSRIKRLVYGCPDPRWGGVESLYRLFDDLRFNHKVEILAGLEAQACAGLLVDFFGARRRQNKEEHQ